MAETIFDIISIAAVLIPTMLIIFFIPISIYLKQHTKRTLKRSIQDNKIKFLKYSPKLLRIWLHKDPEGKWALISRFFFSYNNEETCVNGQALFHNKTLLDLKFYPPEYKDPNGVFPIISANDEIAPEITPNDKNVITFPKADTQ